MDFRESNEAPLINPQDNTMPKLTDEEYEISSNSKTSGGYLTGIQNKDSLNLTPHGQIIQHDNKPFIVQQGFPVNDNNPYLGVNITNINKVEPTPNPKKYKDIDIPNYEYPSK